MLIKCLIYRFYSKSVKSVLNGFNMLFYLPWPTYFELYLANEKSYTFILVTFLFLAHRNNLICYLTLFMPRLCSYYCVHVGYVFFPIRLSLVYIYLPIIRRELLQWKEEWNSHRIRRQSNTECPAGVPEDNYYFPEAVGKKWFQC